MAADMFRFLEKYVGTYRVLAPYDYEKEDFPRDEEGNIDPTFDDLYIPCSKGQIRHSYRDGVLVWLSDNYSQGKTLDKLMADKNISHEYDEVGEDVLIYFNDSDIKRVADIVKPKTFKCGVSPYDKSNLPNNGSVELEYKIPKSDLETLKNITSSLSKSDNLHLSKQWLKEFDTEIKAKYKANGKKRCNIEKERKKSGLNAKTFIHSIGMWEDYCEFVKTKMEQLNE